MKHETIPHVLLASLALVGCNISREKKMPNVILIMADDMGYECLGCYGSLSYNTPVLDLSLLLSAGLMLSERVQFIAD